MDIFIEHLVPKKKDMKDKLIIAGVIAAGIIVTLALFALMFIFTFASTNQNGTNGIGSMSFSIGLVLVLFAWYCAYLLINTRSVEYEYIMTNNEIDIDKVMSKKGRKHLISFDIKEAECMARIDDDTANDVYKNIPPGVKLLNYSAMSDNGYTYFVDCNIDDEHVIVLWQPTEKMVEGLWKFNPRAVKKYSD